MPEITIYDLDHRLAFLEGWKEAQDKVFLGFKEDLQELKNRIVILEQKIDQQFRWIVGIQIAILLAVLGVLFRMAG